MMTLKTTKPQKRILALIGCMMCALLLFGCGSTEGTLEGYMQEHSDAAQQIEQQMKNMETDDAAIEVAYEGNQLIINCNLKETYDESTASALKESYDETMDDAIAAFMTERTAALEDSTGISGIQILFRVNNGDGAEIWSGEYQSDAAVDEEDAKDAATEETTSSEDASEE